MGVAVLEKPFKSGWAMLQRLRWCLNRYSGQAANQDPVWLGTKTTDLLRKPMKLWG